MSTVGGVQHCLRSSFFGSDDFPAENDIWQLAGRIRNPIDYSYATGHRAVELRCCVTAIVCR